MDIILAVIMTVATLFAFYTPVYEAFRFPYNGVKEFLNTYILIFVNAAFFTLFAVSEKFWWVLILPVVLIAVGTVAMIRIKTYKEPEPEYGCSYCESGVYHKVFITAPPGWGSVMECNSLTRRNGRIVFSEENIREMRIG